MDLRIHNQRHVRCSECFRIIHIDWGNSMNFVLHYVWWEIFSLNFLKNACMRFSSNSLKVEYRRTLLNVATAKKILRMALKKFRFQQQNFKQPSFFAKLHSFSGTHISSDDTHSYFNKCKRKTTTLLKNTDSSPILASLMYIHIKRIYVCTTAKNLH